VPSMWARVFHRIYPRVYELELEVDDEIGNVPTRSAHPVAG
jgi:hypothetical protein